MKSIFKTSLIASAVLALPGVALANQELLKLQDDPNQWVHPSGNYNGNRYSKLDQINAGNVNNLRVAWQFSTGVLRGHEGGPLVLGDVMYIHTPIPNIVFALDLNDQWPHHLALQSSRRWQVSWWSNPGSRHQRHVLR